MYFVHLLCLSQEFVCLSFRGFLPQKPTFGFVNCPRPPLITLIFVLIHTITFILQGDLLCCFHFSASLIFTSLYCTFLFPKKCIQSYNFLYKKCFSISSLILYIFVFNIKYFLIFLVISSLPQGLFRDMIFNFQKYFSSPFCYWFLLLLHLI